MRPMIQLMSSEQKIFGVWAIVTHWYDGGIIPNSAENGKLVIYQDNMNVVYYDKLPSLSVEDFSKDLRAHLNIRFGSRLEKYYKDICDEEKTTWYPIGGIM